MDLTLSAKKILSAKNLSVSFSGNRALNVSAITIHAGEIVGVIGSNGAGKSTLVNALAGWSRGEPEASGDILYNGEAIDRWPAHKRAEAGALLVPEGKLVFSTMTVEENLSLAPSRDSSKDKKRHWYTKDDIFSLFPRLKERRNHLGSQLSGGERQMLGIGRALMMGPRLLMLDEPSIGLAPLMIRQVFSTVRSLAKDGLAILLVEQNVRAAREVVDRLLVLERGRVIMEGSADEVGHDPRVAQAYLGAAKI
jgi:branched-chain amino acid transport system ATP-binding protein